MLETMKRLSDCIRFSDVRIWRFYFHPYTAEFDQNSSLSAPYINIESSLKNKIYNKTKYSTVSALHFDFFPFCFVCLVICSGSSFTSLLTSIWAKSATIRSLSMTRRLTSDLACAKASWAAVSLDFWLWSFALSSSCIWTLTSSSRPRTLSCWLTSDWVTWAKSTLRASTLSWAGEKHTYWSYQQIYN